MGSITIYDVARRAGVSMKTVSRVLNGEPHVRETVRAQVLEAAQALNYRPNPSARALASSRSFLIGLCFNNPVPEYVSQIEYGALSACRRLGYHLIVEEFAGLETGRDMEAFLSAIRTDGVILTPPLSDDASVIAALQAKHVRYVRIAPAPIEGGAPDPAPRVFMDDFRAAYEMTAFLRSLGHRDIAFIAGPANHAAAARRYDGWLATMEAAGSRPPAEHIRQGDFTFRSGLEAGEALLSLGDRPTAIFAANDDMALGVMATAQRLRLDVPRDLSIVGFNDTPSAQVVWPQLTTVRQPTAEMAASAVEMLVAACAPGAGGQTEAARQLDFQLVLRDSAAAPTSPPRR